jgi:hypothetical protein
MQSQLPSQVYVWDVLPSRFQSELTLDKLEICRLCSLPEQSGSTDGDFNREFEEKQIIDELADILVQTVDEHVIGREISNSIGRRAGRPREVMIRCLGPKLLSFYLRYHDSAGRQSVVTSVDGKPKQKESGQLFEFIKTIIEPLNRYLTTELHCRPLSASRLARFAPSDRRKTLRALERRRKKALENASVNHGLAQ